MVRRFPLLAKILAWFLLNLVLLGLVAWLFLQQQLHFGLEALLAGGAGERLRTTANVIARDLTEHPRSSWSAVLAKYENLYPVHFAVFASNGTQLAGTPLPLPEELRPVVIRNRPGPPDQGREPNREPRGGPGPPPPRDGRPAADQPPPPPPRPGTDILAFKRAGEPPQYWTVMRAPISGEPRQPPPTLAVVSPTLGVGGMIFDLPSVLWAGAGLLVFCALFWFPLVHSITRSIGAMRRATSTIAEGDFETRVETRRRDELGDLGEAINTMAERLAGLVNGQKRFLSDVAHELCAPLARLQMALGILEEQAAASDGRRLADVREEVDHMSGLVNELLSFSKASLGAKGTVCRPLSLRELVERVAHREAVPGADLEIQCDPALTVLADGHLLQRALGNLVRNAIRYAAGAGPIGLRAEPQGATVAISVTDHGPGVPEEALSRLFDPFYRVDTSRTRETGGVGLGLTIARTCVEACGGKIAAENAETGGLRVTLWLAAAEKALPAAPEARPAVALG